MREIKFRVWDILNKKMIDGVMAICSGEGGWVLFTSEVDDSLRCHHAIHDIRQYEIMQYTGFVDKNGKEIYEGDILQGLFDVRQEVFHFNEGGYIVSGFALRRIKSKDEPNAAFSVTSRDWLTVAEVIGNIHESPELLNAST